MYVRVPQILAKFGIPKSSLFKSIHEHRITSIRVYRQYYVYWPDVRQYIIHQVVPGLIWWTTVRLPCPLPKGTITAHQAITTLNINRRLWQSQMKPILAETPNKDYAWEDIETAISTLRNQSHQQYRTILEEMEVYDFEYVRFLERQLTICMSVDGAFQYVLARIPHTFDNGDVEEE